MIPLNMLIYDRGAVSDPISNGAEPAHDLRRKR